MFERSETILKLICLALSILLLFQFARKSRGPDPLAQLTLVSTRVTAQITPPADNPTPTNAPPSSENKNPNTNTNSHPASAPSANPALTNTPPAHPHPGSRPVPGPGPGGRPGPGGTPGRTVPEIPSGVQAGIDRIHQSEIFGPVPRPQPMALIGIAGSDAIIRTPNGQTLLMKEGDENGGVKLLRIGTNRVLVEHEGDKKELNIFSGFGSETLLQK
jgi:hypothetical protein